MINLSIIARVFICAIMFLGDYMETIIYNKNNLEEKDITEVVKRVKLFMINSKNEILMGYSHNEYHCPGGHVEEGESLIDAINREVEEETGIVLNLKELTPFACTLGYYKDWPEEGKNRKTEIYYYEIKTDEKPNLSNTHYDEGELEGNFELKYIPLDKVEEEFIKNSNIYGDKHGIKKEMLKIFEIYKSLKH